MQVACIRDMDEHLTQLRWDLMEAVLPVVGQTLDLEKALRSILSTLAHRTNTRRGAVALRLSDRQALSLGATLGQSPSDLDLEFYSLQHGAAQVFLQSGRPFFLLDQELQPVFLERDDPRLAQTQGWRVMGLPLVSQGKTLGILSVDRVLAAPATLGDQLACLEPLAGLTAQLVALNHQSAQRLALLRRANQGLRAEVRGLLGGQSLVGESAALREVASLVGKVAPSEASVLLIGPSGVGKRLVAHLIHERSRRATGPLVVWSCPPSEDGAAQKTLFDADLFPQTGSDQPRGSALLRAQGGTLYLDRVDRLGLRMQDRLLRFLRHRELLPPGGGQPVKVDLRLVASTAVPLDQLAAQGRFRPELHYQLAVFPLTIPALAQRRDDIAPLLWHFLGQAGQEMGRRLEFSPQALTALKAYSWPGNASELRDLVMLLARRVQGRRIGMADLPTWVLDCEPSAEAVSPDGLSRLEQMERREVVAALERHNWVQSHAAAELGLTLRQIGYRIKKFGLYQTMKQRRRLAEPPMGLSALSGGGVM